MTTETFFEIRLKGVDVDILDVAVAVELSVFLGVALCLSHVSPVRGLVAGSSEPCLLQKCFQEIERVAIDRLPVAGNLLNRAPKDMRGQISDLNPGQNEKSSLDWMRNTLELQDRQANGISST